MTNYKLRSCPFCGGAMTYEEQYTYCDHGGLYYRITGDHMDGCIMEDTELPVFEDEEFLAESWNERA